MTAAPEPLVDAENDQPVGRCEWCPDKVWPDQRYLSSSGYLWHEECAERCSSLLDQGTLIDGSPEAT